MEKLFVLERNDECICGSGKKYKKCCLPSIENFQRKLSSYMDGDITAEGYEIIRVVSVILGMEPDTAQNVIEPKLVAEILDRLWDEEESIWKSDVKVDMMTEKVVELLRSKEKLYFVRFGGELIYGKDFDDDKEIASFIEDFIEDTFFVEDLLLDIGSSIRTENYTQEELETAIFAISSAIHTGTRPAFLFAVLKSSLMDIQEAEEEFSKLHEESEGAEINHKDVIAIFERYPVFEGYFGSFLKDAAEDTLKLLFEGKINIQMPFYSVYGIYLNVITIIYSSLVKVSSLEDISQRITKRYVELMGSLLLLEPEQLNIFYSALVEAIDKKLNEETDEVMKEKLEDLLNFFIFILTSQQFETVQKFFIYTLQNFISSIPFTVEESGLVVQTIETLFKEDFAKSYVSYLKEKGLAEEAEYIEKSFEEYIKISTKVTQNLADIIMNHIKRIR